MRKTAFPSVFLTVVILVTTSCNLGDALSVKVDADFDIDLPVEVTGQEMKTGPFSFSSTKTIDLSKEPALVDYLDNVKSITLKELSTTISGLSKDVTLLQATLTITGGTHTASWSVSNKALKNGETLTGGNDNGQYDAISSMLTALGSVTVTFTGTSDVNNVVFTLKNALKTQIAAGLGG